MKGWIGIDPGKKGCACLLSYDDVQFLGWSDDKEEMLEILYEWNTTYSIEGVVIEKVGSMPGQGVKSMFTFGENFGWWQGAMTVLTGVNPFFVTPRKWQMSVLDDGCDDIKIKSVRVANSIGNLGLKLTKNGKDNGKADAYHLARYSKEVFSKI